MQFRILLPRYIMNKQLNILKVLGMLAILASQSMATEYCEICSNHIGCRNNGALGTACPTDANVIAATPEIQKIILDLHNKLRNDTALGELNGFSPARRMAFTKWDDELSNLASMNSKRCIFAHDECRDTDDFLWAGQNLGIYGQSDDYPDTDSTIALLINLWFDEYKTTNMDVIRSYNLPRRGRPANGHFTAMVNEKQTSMGCGLIQYKSGRFYNLFLVCNYAMTNVLGAPVYQSGTACSGCTTGCHPICKGLCNENEPIVAEP